MPDFDVDRRDGVVWARFGDGESNLIDEHLLQGLTRLIGEIRMDLNVRVLILSGLGKTFSMGSDLTRLQGIQALPSECERTVAMLNSVLGAFQEASVVTIAAVNGPVRESGLELALACDFILASEQATFTDGHIGLGLLGGGGNTQRLPRAIGTRRATYLALTGVTIDSATADRWGLVTSVFAANDFVENVWSVAGSISKQPASAAHAVRHLIRLFDSSTIYSGLAEERSMAVQQMVSAEAIAGVLKRLNSSPA